MIFTSLLSAILMTFIKCLLVSKYCIQILPLAVFFTQIEDRIWINGLFTFCFGNMARREHSTSRSLLYLLLMSLTNVPWFLLLSWVSLCWMSFYWVFLVLVVTQTPFGSFSTQIEDRIWINGLFTFCFSDMARCVHSTSRSQ